LGKGRVNQDRGGGERKSEADVMKQERAFFADGSGESSLVSNGIAILCCSLVNFYLGDQWAFAVLGE
jgi:hypothetical protein